MKSEHAIQFTSNTGEPEELTWESAMDRYYESLFSYCYRMLGEREDAEDLTQEVFIRAFRNTKNASATPIPSNPRSWLYTIAHNLCIDRLRWWKRWKRVILQEDAVSRPGPQPDEQMTLLAPLITSLPQSQRQVFLLRHLHDFSTSETAQLLRISEGTVKSTLSRAVRNLRDKIEREEKK